MASSAVLQFIEKLYSNVLLRPADSPGLQYWASKADAGVSASDIAKSFISSGEAANVTSVLRLYDVFFDRPTDSGGLTYWTNAMKSGISLRDISNSFTNTAEFASKFGGLSTSAYVDKLYSNIFGRAADAGGKEYWVRMIDSGALPKGDLGLHLASSPEALLSTSAATRAAESYLVLRASGVTDPTSSSVTSLVGKSLDAALAEKVSGFSGSAVTLSGFAGKGLLDGATVSFTINGETFTAITGPDGRYEIPLPTLPTGPLPNLTVSGGTDLTTGRPFTGSLSAPIPADLNTPVNVTVFSTLAAAGMDPAAIAEMLGGRDPSELSPEDFDSATDGLEAMALQLYTLVADKLDSVDGLDANNPADLVGAFSALTGFLEQFADSGNLADIMGSIDPSVLEAMAETSLTAATQIMLAAGPDGVFDFAQLDAAMADLAGAVDQSFFDAIAAGGDIDLADLNASLSSAMESSLGDLAAELGLDLGDILAGLEDSLGGILDGLPDDLPPPPDDVGGGGSDMSSYDAFLTSTLSLDADDITVDQGYFKLSTEAAENLIANGYDSSDFLSAGFSQDLVLNVSGTFLDGGQDGADFASSLNTFGIDRYEIDDAAALTLTTGTVDADVQTLLGAVTGDVFLMVDGTLLGNAISGADGQVLTLSELQLLGVDTIVADSAAVDLYLPDAAITGTSESYLDSLTFVSNGDVYADGTILNTIDSDGPGTGWGIDFTDTSSGWASEDYTYSS